MDFRQDVKVSRCAKFSFFPHIQKLWMTYKEKLELFNCAEAKRKTSQDQGKQGLEAVRLAEPRICEVGMKEANLGSRISK